MGSRETIGERSRTHGMSNSRLYNIWCGMKDRCNNPNTEHYNVYGGKGISVCGDWQSSFESFRDWSFENGFNEKSTGKEQSIDRIDPNGDYCPDNCRWVSKLVQARNRTDTMYVNYHGSCISAREFTENNGISDYAFVYRRAKKGETGEKIKHDWEMLHNTPDNFMRVPEAAEMYDVSTETVKLWVKSGKIKAKRCGNVLFIQKGQVVERDNGRDKFGRFIPKRKK